jgi:choline dehydrogenase
LPQVVVVGAGSAGAVVAARLSEDPATDVLLLEAGPDYPTADEMPAEIRSAWRFSAEHDWGYHDFAPVAQAAAGPGFGSAAGEALPVPAGRVVGGSSAVNGTNALRPHPSDFDHWVGLGNDQWSWEAVLPYFRRAEDDPPGGAWHGEGGPVPIRRFAGEQLRPVMRAFVDVCTRAGHRLLDDLNAPGAVGVGSLPLNQLDGVRQSSAVAYLGPARGRANFELRADAAVDRVLVVDGRAVAVVLAGTAERIEADMVVLCAGAIGSPAILQRSGIGPAASLDAAGVRQIHRLDGVGRNLREHPMSYPTWAADPGVAGPDVPPLQVLLACGASGVPGGAQVDLNIVPLAVRPDEISVAVPLVRPYSVGSVAVASADPEAGPRICLNLYGHIDDLRRSVSGIRIARSLVAIPALGGHFGDELWPGADVATDGELARALRAAPAAGAHMSGTCSMGPCGAHWAVVDQGGAVHGIDGLHVVDASIMPMVPSAPPNMTVIMVAERCSELLSAR